MLVLELHEVISIDSRISELHTQLESLYKERAAITNVKDSASVGLAKSIDDSINLDGIDLSL